MKVFLSSTALDLTEHRKVADDTILCVAQSVAMERFGPLPETPVKECERLARESDVLVCIVAHRYGFVPERGQGSITRREVQAAKDAGRAVLVWIVADNHPWTEKKEQDLLADPNVLMSPERVAEVTEGVKGLLEFKAWLRTTFTPDTFTTPDDLGRKIAVALANYVNGHAVPPIPQEKVSISRLPTTGSELFGREKELQLLDDAWANPNTNIVSLVAWGGVGKTALVNHWLKRRMARDNYRGAEKVFGWSFFSQGTSEPAASADLFIDQALRWFSDPDPTAGTPWDKGARLARHIRQSRALLILDGLEPLQYPPGPQEGRLKDAALQALLVELAAHQPGVCVISTRERVVDLVEFENATVVQHNLEHLSPEAGARILRSLNVKGDDEELEEAAKELDGHAFSLTLLGSYVNEVLDGDIRLRKEIGNLFDDTRYGDAAEKMIAAYEQWLGEGIELAMLHLLGLFDGPAEVGSIIALREPPTIAGLTEPFEHFKGREWNQAVAKLRRIRLIREAAQEEPSKLDAHPLVREYFKQQLKRERPTGWREANKRLFEHLKNTTKEFPETVEEMSPLYSAVRHGCAAQNYEEALDIYALRIQRGQEYFNWHTLGAYGADLVALSGFFERAWELPVAVLPKQLQGFVLNDAAVDLRALGRLHEAVEPLNSSLKIAVSDEDWASASISAQNFALLCMSIGDLSGALTVARRGVEYAELSDDSSHRSTALAVLGAALNCKGLTDEAAATFYDAEMSLPEQWRAAYSFINLWYGFAFCDLLLAQGKVEEVKKRASRTLEYSRAKDLRGMMGLDFLSLSRASTLEAQRALNSDFTIAAHFMSQAMHFLRQGGHMDRVLSGLLTSAELSRLQNDFEQAERDLTEVLRVAKRSEMRLHLADYHLTAARLRIAETKKEKAREHLAAAKEMIEQMGYHRRDKEVAELESQLA